MRAQCLIAACVLVAACGAVSLDGAWPPQPPDHPKPKFGDATVVVTVKEHSRQSGSSSSSSSNSSSQHSLAEKKEWERKSLNLGDDKKLKTKSKVDRHEAGRSSKAGTDNSAKGSSEVAKKTLTVGGVDVIVDEKGTSDSFKKTNSSSSETEFEKSVTVEIDREVKQQRLNLHCVAERQLNVFVILHLNRNWRRKLRFLRRFILDTYDASRINYHCVLFNDLTYAFGTFGPRALTSKEKLLARLKKVEEMMKEEEEAQMTEYWSEFRLDSALRNCFIYARGFLKKFNLHDRPSMLISYFDDNAAVSQSVAKTVGEMFNKKNPFRLRMNVMQQVSGGRNARLWERVAKLMSTSEAYRLDVPKESQVLESMSKMLGSACASKYLK